MKILTLAALEPGDVILEAGLAAVASATNGPYGHASIALCKLVKIEAGKDEGVVIAPFDLVAYNRKGIDSSECRYATAIPWLCSGAS